MNEPTFHKPSWQVYTTDAIYKQAWSGTMEPGWAWVAYGPRGSESGVEEHPGDAVQKAQAACFLLDDPKRAVQAA